jgi:hypothetical protein
MCSTAFYGYDGSKCFILQKAVNCDYFIVILNFVKNIFFEF